VQVVAACDGCEQHELRGTVLHHVHHHFRPVLRMATR
jgi:hypothetical protein